MRFATWPRCRGCPAEVHLVGSHGSEFDLDFVTALEPDQRRPARTPDARSAPGIVDGVDGASLERKPASVAVHVRRADREEAADGASTASAPVPATWPGVTVTEGKEVDRARGRAHRQGRTRSTCCGTRSAPRATLLRRRRRHRRGRASPSCSGPDVGVKVGAGRLAGRVPHRRPDAGGRAARAAGRGTARTGSSGAEAVPIEEVAFLSDGTTMALVDPERIGHLAVPPRARLVGRVRRAARRPLGRAPRRSRPLLGAKPLVAAYVGDTVMLRTRWAGLDVIDYLDRSHRQDEPSVTRLVRAMSGTVPAQIVFAPRPEFGQVSVQLEVVDDGIKVNGAAEPIVLHAPGVEWQIHAEGPHETATGGGRPHRRRGGRRAAVRHQRPERRPPERTRATPRSPAATGRSGR